MNNKENRSIDEPFEPSVDQDFSLFEEEKEEIRNKILKIIQKWNVTGGMVSKFKISESDLSKLRQVYTPRKLNKIHLTVEKLFPVGDFLEYFINCQLFDGKIRHVKSTVYSQSRFNDIVFRWV